MFFSSLKCGLFLSNVKAENVAKEAHSLSHQAYDMCSKSLFIGLKNFLPLIIEYNKVILESFFP